MIKSFVSSFSNSVIFFRKLLFNLYYRALNNKIRNRNKVIERKFNRFCNIENPIKIIKVKKLLENKDKINFEIENYTTKENQRDLSIKFHWGHDHIFNKNIKIKGKMGLRHLELINQFLTYFRLDENYFNKKRTLDVGCWTGGTSLALLLMGAKFVTGLEEVKKYSQSSIELINDIYEIKNFEGICKSVYEFTCIEKYDLIYVPGVIYHVSDPVVFLRKLFLALNLNSDILIETAGIFRIGSYSRFDGNYLTTVGSQKDLNRSGWNHYIPSSKCLYRWMQEAGFENIEIFYNHSSNRIFAKGTKIKDKQITLAGLSNRNL